MQKLRSAARLTLTLAIAAAVLLFWLCLVPALLAPYPPIVHLLTGGN